MTHSENKRYAQARAVLSQSSRTEGEKSAAREIMARIERKVSDRRAVRVKFEVTEMYRPIVDSYA